MNTKYCLPIIKSDKKEVLKSLQSKGYDYFEIWLDYIRDLDEKFILHIAEKYQKKLIFLFRRQNLEKIKMPLEERQEIIALVSKSNVSFDIDFLTQFEELTLLKTFKKVKLILSYHNYKETPSMDYLKNIVNKMKQFNPWIYKIAAFCKIEEDGLNLLNLQLKLKAQKINAVVLGMGPKGLITRVFGPLFGSEIIFAPQIITEKSAPGQLTKRQMEEIFGILRK